MNDNEMTVKERVWEILQLARAAKELGDIVFNFAGKRIPCHDGWVAQSVFANPEITGLCEGKRRLREIRANPAIASKWIFETKHKNGCWYYRIRMREYACRQNHIFMPV